MKTKKHIASITFFLIVSAITGVAFSATENSAQPASSILPAGAMAVVNGTPIPQTQLDNVVKESGQPDTAQLRQVIKQQLIAREVFKQNAEKAHYADRPEVKEAINNAKINAEVQLYLKDGVHPNPVTDQDVKAKYDQAASLLGKDEFRASVISVADDAAAATVLSKLRSGDAFESLAEQYSLAASKDNGGAMPWVSIKTPVTEGNTSGLPVSVAQALVNMKVGTTSKTPVEAGTMRVILKLDEKRPTVVPTYDQSQAAIRQQLEAAETQKAVDAFVSTQVAKASIQQ